MGVQALQFGSVAKVVWLTVLYITKNAVLFYSELMRTFIYENKKPIQLYLG